MSTNRQPPQTATPERKYAKARAVAQRFGICARTITRWADSGHIARYKLSARTVVFDEFEVERYVASHRV